MCCRCCSTSETFLRVRRRAGATHSWNAAQQRRDRAAGNGETGQARWRQHRGHVRLGTDVGQRPLRRGQVSPARVHRRTGSRQGDRQEQAGRGIPQSSVPRGTLI